MQNMTRNVALLAVCQALMMTCNSLLIATSALVGLRLASAPALSTLPVGMQFLATMLATLPASLLMQRVGRRAGFMAGSAVGLAGALLCVAGLIQASFALFLCGTFAIGVFNAFGQYYRFAAADAAGTAFRSRAISLVLAGGVVAAFAGPNLARATRELWPAASFAGSYAALIGLYLASLAVVAFVRIPCPPRAVDGGGARGLGRIARQPAFVVAVAGAMIAYGVMNLIMTATPLAMLHEGHAFGDTAFVIQWHVLAMFAPSFVTGHLIRRFGVLDVMLAGGGLLGACTVLNLLGTGVAHFWAGLVVLGLGWNFLFVGATTLLTETYAEAEKAKTQGLNDLLIFAVVALTATTSGFVHHLLGWQAINLGAIPWVAAALLATAWLRVQRARAAAPVAAS